MLAANRPTQFFSADAGPAANGKMSKTENVRLSVFLILFAATEVQPAEDLFKVLSYNTWGTGGNVSVLFKRPIVA